MRRVAAITGACALFLAIGFCGVDLEPTGARYDRPDEHQISLGGTG